MSTLIDALPAFVADSGRDYAERTDLPSMRDRLIEFFSEFTRIVQDEASALDLGADIKLLDLAYSELDRELLQRDGSGPAGSTRRMSRLLGLLMDRLIDHKDRLPVALSWMRARADALGDVLEQNNAQGYAGPLEGAVAGHYALLGRMVAQHYAGKLAAFELLSYPAGFIPEPMPFTEFDRGRDHFDSGIPFDNLNLDYATKKFAAAWNLRLRRIESTNVRDDARILPADPRARRMLPVYKRACPYFTKLELGEKLEPGVGSDFETFNVGAMVGQQGWADLPGSSSPTVLRDLTLGSSYSGTSSAQFAPGTGSGPSGARFVMSPTSTVILAGFRVLVKPADRYTENANQGMRMVLRGTGNVVVFQVGITRSHLITSLNGRINYTQVPEFLDSSRWHHVGVRLDLFNDIADVWVDNMLVARTVAVENSSLLLTAVELIADGPVGDVFLVDEVRAHGALEAA